MTLNTLKNIKILKRFYFSLFFLVLIILSLVAYFYLVNINDKYGVITITNNGFLQKSENELLNGQYLFVDSDILFPLNKNNNFNLQLYSTSYIVDFNHNDRNSFYTEFVKWSNRHIKEFSHCPKPKDLTFFKTNINLDMLVLIERLYNHIGNNRKVLSSGEFNQGYSYNDEFTQKLKNISENIQNINLRNETKSYGTHHTINFGNCTKPKITLDYIKSKNSIIMNTFYDLLFAGDPINYSLRKFVFVFF